MDARDDLHLGVERTDVGQATAVDADALTQHAAAHDHLRNRLVRCRDLREHLGVERAGFDLLGQSDLDTLLERVVGVLALDLVGDLVDTHELVVGEAGDVVVGLLRVRQEHRVLGDSLRGLLCEHVLCTDQLLEERLRSFEALGHDLFVRLGGAALDEVPAAFGSLGLDHHDGDVFRTVRSSDHTAGDDDVEDGLLELRHRRERDPLVFSSTVTGDERKAHRTDRAAERQAGDLGRHRGRIDRKSVVELAGSDAQDGDDDLDLVAEAFDERRAQRAVDETADQDRLSGGTTLTAEERAGDLACGVGTLFDIHRQREEVEVVLGVLARAGRAQQHGLLVEVGRDCALGLLGETARFEADRARAETSVVENGFGEFDFWTFQEVFLLCSVLLTAPCGRRGATPYGRRLVHRSRGNRQIDTRVYVYVRPPTRSLVSRREPLGGRASGHQ